MTFMATWPRARHNVRDLVRCSAGLLVGVFVVLGALCAVDGVIAHLDHPGLDGCCGITHCSSAVLGLVGFVVWAVISAGHPAIDGAAPWIAMRPLLPPPKRLLLFVV